MSENEFALIETYYDKASTIIEDLEKVGALKSTIADVYDYFDHTPLNKAPRGRALVPLRPDGKIGRGLELVRQLRTWLTDKKVPMLVNHRVTAVERNGRGEVIGVTAATREGPIVLRANRAVIFATGGYSQNAELLQTFRPNRNFGWRDARKHGERMALSGCIGGSSKVAKCHRYTGNPAGRQHADGEQRRSPRRG